MKNGIISVALKVAAAVIMLAAAYEAYRCIRYTFHYARLTGEAVKLWRKAF